MLCYFSCTKRPLQCFRIREWHKTNTRTHVGLPPRDLPSSGPLRFLTHALLLTFDCVISVPIKVTRSPGFAQISGGSFYPDQANFCHRQSKKHRPQTDVLWAGRCISVLFKSPRGSTISTLSLLWLPNISSSIWLSNSERISFSALALALNMQHSLQMNRAPDMATLASNPKFIPYAEQINLNTQPHASSHPLPRSTNAHVPHHFLRHHDVSANNTKRTPAPREPQAQG